MWIYQIENFFLLQNYQHDSPSLHTELMLWTHVHYHNQIGELMDILSKLIRVHDIILLVIIL